MKYYDNYGLGSRKGRGGNWFQWGKTNGQMINNIVKNTQDACGFGKDRQEKPDKLLIHQKTT